MSTDHNHHHHHSHKHSHGHNHNHHHHGSEFKSGPALFWAIVLNLLLSVVQFIIGVFSGSLSLVADAIHNLGDVGSLVIAYVAQKISGLKATEKMTYGYGRAEVIGAFVNSILLIITAIYLMFEAFERFNSDVEIKGLWVIAAGALALVIDLFTALLTYKGSKDSVNMRAAFIHNLSDALASVAVIISGVTAYYFQMFWVDFVATVFISVFILYHSYGLIVSCVRTLMQAVPSYVNIENVKAGVLKVSGVKDIHHVHIWEIDHKKCFLEGHIIVDAKEFDEVESIKFKIKEVLKSDFSIEHSTLEFEYQEKTC